MRITSRIDVRSAAYAENRTTMLAALDEMNALTAQVVRGGGSGDAEKDARSVAKFTVAVTPGTVASAPSIRPAQVTSFPLVRGRRVSWSLVNEFVASAVDGLFQGGNVNVCFALNVQSRLTVCHEIDADSSNPRDERCCS